MSLHPLVQYAADRIKKNQNLLCVITGGTGSGKSYAAISLAFATNKANGVNKDPKVFYDLDEFIEMLKTGKHEPGQSIVIDEAGLMAGSRNFMTKANKIISMISQSFRFMRLVTFFCVPDISFVDVHVRKLVHCWLITEGIDYKRNICYLSPKLMKSNQYTGKVLPSSFYVRNHKGEVQRMSKVGVCKPPELFIKKYESQKEQYIKAILAKFQQEISGDPGKEIDRKIKGISDHIKKRYHK